MCTEVDRHARIGRPEVQSARSFFTASWTDLGRSRLGTPGWGAGAGDLRSSCYWNATASHIAQGQIASWSLTCRFWRPRGTSRPFMGLLGTVLGIIDSFREIGLQGTASISAVAPGVSEALVATAAGLFAAIPAVIAYNYFLTRIRRTAFRMDIR